ncbi:MAG: arginine--tRNA ligase [Eubacteriales bacterium]|nr:arginine--tRNA ligase [Eubacteriales bacterium]MDD4422257.1 arginine--tRNA ligase [Eubacteriales bacterium]
MQKIKEIIAKKITEIISNTGYKTDEDEILSFIDIPVDSKMGDLALPCFKLARIMRSAPPKIALELKESIGELPFIKRVEAVGGYLNFFVDAFYYKELLDRILFDADYGRSEVGRGKVVCLDFSSCNIAKRFHVGHIGSTTIGNALRNIYAFCGYKCVAINHLGDWGTNFGKMIAAYKLYSRKEKVDERGINELVDIYVRFNDEEKKNNALSDMARNAFTKLENGDEEYLEIWQYFKDISIKEYNKTYELLGISFDSYNGEAFFSDKIPGVIEELRQKNLLEKDNGAFIVRLEDYNLTNTVVLKSDGSSLYVARDIAAAIWRKKEYDFDKCIYVTSAGQSLHFAQCFKIVELMGYEWSKNLVHVPYGTMSINGEKLASRTGNVIHLDDLLAESISKCEKIIEEKNAELKDKKSVARAVGVGAIIFNALANSRIKDTNFVWEEALSFEGNTGPYVQYTYARSSSVLRKAGMDSVDDVKTAYPDLSSEEITLVKKLSEFPAAVNRALEENEPSVIARYTLALCSDFNQFYHNCPILRSEGAARAFRLKLTKCVRKVLGVSLDLLGMKRTEEI